MQPPGDGDIPAAGLVCSAGTERQVEDRRAFFLIIIYEAKNLEKKAKTPGVSTSRRLAH